MAPSNKKTTMAKLNRERRLRERRMAKQAKKEARKNAPEHQPEPSGIDATFSVHPTTAAEQPALESVVPPRASPDPA
jgi:hypothetical protein